MTWDSATEAYNESGHEWAQTHPIPWAEQDRNRANRNGTGTLDKGGEMRENVGMAATDKEGRIYMQGITYEEAMTPTTLVNSDQARREVRVHDASWADFLAEVMPARTRHGVTMYRTHDILTWLGY